VEEPIPNDINHSVAIGLEVDETTDISVSRQLGLVRVTFCKNYDNATISCLHQIHRWTGLQSIY